MTQRAKLKWHCRRGIRELDVLLDDFLEGQYGSSTPAVREAFARLLDCDNEDLRAWLLEGQSPQDEQLTDIVSRILESRLSGG